MSNGKNYNKAYKPKSEVAETKVEKATVEEVEEIVEPKTEPVEIPKFKTGVVADCTRLNVRKGPNKTAGILFTIDVNTKVTIDVAKSTDGWYYVATAKGEGFCMKDYIKM